MMMGRVLPSTPPAEAEASAWWGLGECDVMRCDTNISCYTIYILTEKKGLGIFGEQRESELP